MNGREYQHIEDLIIFNGSDGAKLAADQLLEISKDFSILDYKWDGVASIFWGRHSDGTFGLYPKNQWRKKIPLSKLELLNEILLTNKTQGFSVRSELAKRYDLLWDRLSNTTPNNFRGFLNGDLLWNSPTPTNITHCIPNKVAYYPNVNTSVLIAVHGFLSDFGESVSDGISDYQGHLSQNSNVFLIPTVKPSGSANLDPVLSLCLQINSSAADIDYISNFSVPRFTTLQQVLYKYATAYAKHGVTINDWTTSSSMSDFHKNHLFNLTSTPQWKVFWETFVSIKSVKHELLAAIYSQQNNSLCTASIKNKFVGEGFVCRMKNGSLGKLITEEFRKA